MQFIRHGIAAATCVWDVCTYVVRKYVDVYNHLSDSVLTQNHAYAKLVRYERTTGTAVVFDQGWWFWLVALYVLKLAVGAHFIRPLLYRADHLAVERENVLYELSRGKGNAHHVALGRCPQRALVAETKDDYKKIAILSAYAEHVSDCTDTVCVTKFLRQRLPFLNKTNGFRAGELLHVALSSMSPHRRQRPFWNLFTLRHGGVVCNNNDYKLYVVTETGCTDSRLPPVEEFAFDHADVVAFDAAT